MNRDAWRIYLTLCGRTVGLTGLQGTVLQALTADWSLPDFLDLLRRLDLILDILAPEGRPASHARP